MGEERQVADDVAVEQCDHRHPFNGSQCHKPRWHKGSHVAETPSLVMVWGFGYDEHSDGDIGAAP